MTDAFLDALAGLRFNFAPTPDDVWKPSPYHVEELHREVVEGIFEGVAAARANDQSSPLGVVVRGQAGAGKTHMLGMVRQRIHADTGYFFLVSLLHGTQFWESTALAVVEGLLNDGGTWPTQLKAFLRRLTAMFGLGVDTRDAIAGDRPLTPADLSAFIVALRTHDRVVGQEAQDTARAMVLYASTDFTAQDIGRAYLTSVEIDDADERTRWGIGRATRTPQLIVRDLTRLLALTGPTVIAIDQLDTLFAQTIGGATGRLGDGDSAESLVLLAQVADGLMDLRQTARRTLTVIACQPETWTLIKARSVASVPDRFRELSVLHRIPSAEIGAAIVAKRFALHYAGAGLTPPYPTWPIRPVAFADAPDYTPRRLLKQVEGHITACVRARVLTELDRLDGAPAGSAPPEPARPPRDSAVDRFDALDRRFAELRARADVSGPVDPAVEDRVMPALLGAGLRAWIEEMSGTGRHFKVDPPPPDKPSLHARLRMVVDEATEDEMHWAWRSIAADHAIAVITRIRNASTMAGLDPKVPRRKLTLIRRTPWGRGPKTVELVEAFHAAGGVTRTVSDEDLRTLDALRVMATDADPDLAAWLRSRRPATSTELFRPLTEEFRASTGPAAASAPTAAGSATGSTVVPSARSTVAPGAGADTEPVAGPAVGPSAGPSAGSTVAPGAGAAAWSVAGPAAVPSVEPAVAPGAGAAQPAAPSGLAAKPPPDHVGMAGRVATPPAAVVEEFDTTLRLGVVDASGEPFELPLEALRKHTAIFAGSGSGKTVLIRRLVEECALRGVSAIVLDPNNDLARLGDPWPETPDTWGDGDADRAREYLAATDVVVWTPRRRAGRPLSFQPLPDFASVRDDPDEFRAAIDAAVASLAPRARVDSATVKAQLGQAVLRESLEYFGRRPGGDLRTFVDMLGDLPDDVSALGSGPRIGADMAQTLTAAMVNDPMFGGDGVPVDPGVLLTPVPGKRARVSVISFVGLTSDEQRQGFVNQLQMALFAWIKRNPAGDRPLGGLLVMDEAQTLAPSGTMTPCTASTLALVSQARKYGLGLVFATQAPRGLHNRIPGNSATQFYGLLNAGVQISAAREMAQAKGGTLPDIGLLRAGEFYAAREGTSFTRITAPLCLSYHPKSPLTPDEVIERSTR